MRNRGYLPSELKPAYLLMVQCKHHVARLSRRETIPGDNGSSIVGIDSSTGASGEKTTDNTGADQEGSKIKTEEEHFRNIVECLRQVYGEATPGIVCASAPGSGELYV